MLWTPRGRVLRGSESISFRNHGASAVRTIWLRLWANDSIPGQADGCTNRLITIKHVVGASIERYKVACSAMSLRLDRTLEPGHAGMLRFQFVALAPTYNDLFGRSLGINLFGNVIPVMAVRDRGWHLNPDAQVGDAAFTLAAAWQATISSPSRLTIASTGREASNRVARGLRTVVAETPHARDFAFAIGPMSQRRVVVNGTRIRVFASRPRVGRTPRMRYKSRLRRLEGMKLGTAAMDLPNSIL